MPLTDRDISRFGVRTFPSSVVMAELCSEAIDEFHQVAESFSRLARDRQMGDGGRYRYRRYSRFFLEPGTTTLKSLEGNSILQDLEDNPLNGGVLRTFEPLEREVYESRLLHDLIDFDRRMVVARDPGLFQEPVVVGVHQVRIVTEGRSQGKPTPEGIHRDAERFTFQHFWARVGASGGEFRAYDTQKTPIFSWLQQDRLDSVMFEGTTWHSATPIICHEDRPQGHRDIFLIDFDPATGS